MAVCLTVSDNSIAAGVFSSMFSEVALTSSKTFSEVKLIFSSLDLEWLSTFSMLSWEAFGEFSSVSIVGRFSSFSVWGFSMKKINEE